MRKTVRLIHGECLAEMAKLKDNSVDMVLCDLPYGTAGGMGAGGGTWRVDCGAAECLRALRTYCKMGETGTCRDHGPRAGGSQR